jgi:hypothetical protein
MRKVWAVFNQDPNTKHIFTVPCDSHGLQLLIKDILEQIEWFKTIFNTTQRISTKFRTSPKQLSILHLHQEKKKAFIVAVITRWGTQLAMLVSVKDNQSAIKAYAIDPASDVTHDFKQLVCISDFWQRLDTLLYLFNPIHEAQKMSESDRARLSFVPQRWQTIQTHLHEAKELYPQAQEILDQVFLPRMQKQVIALHWAAFYLDPVNAGKPMTSACQQQIISFLTTHVPDNRKDDITQQFFNYYNKEEEFHPGSSCWSHANKPNLFWSITRVAAPELADLARRLHHTPANSVPSERSFSIGKLIHSRVRASTDPIRVDKQTYIYINKRALARVQDQKVGVFDWGQLGEEERLEWEQSIVESDYIEEKKRAFDQIYGGGILRPYLYCQHFSLSNMLSNCAP